MEDSEYKNTMLLARYLLRQQIKKDIKALNNIAVRYAVVNQKISSHAAASENILKSIAGYALEN